MSGINAARKWLWWIGASVSGLTSLYFIALWFGIADAEQLRIDWAFRTFLGGLLLQSISFVGRPRSLRVLVAWLLVALGVVMGLFGLFNFGTLMFFGFAQLVLIERYFNPPREPLGASRAPDSPSLSR